MKINTQAGFSLIELLLVVTIIGVIAALGVPSFQRGIKAADNGAAFAQMRTFSSAQLSYFSQNSRYARLNELNTIQSGGFGNTTGSGLVKGRFTYEMSPLNPTDTDLKNGYTIVATAVNGGVGVPVVITVDQTGRITSPFSY
jgi:type IV pilus assembly protein PilE